MLNGSNGQWVMTASPALPQTRLAPAKVNLALHVTGRRADGYHTLESIVVFPQIGDGLRLHQREPGAPFLTLTGPYANRLSANADNLVSRAAALLADQTGQSLDGLGMTLDKQLPVEAGIGGGSADAAAALHLLNDYWGKPLSADALCALGLTLGADVPVCLVGQSAYMGGIGEIVRPLSTPIHGALVLLNPGVAVPTGPVFKGLNGLFGNGFGDLPNQVDAGWLAHQRNDLERPAISLAPVIATALNAMGETDHCQLARMSGSGATLFGLYPDIECARDAAGALGAAYPDWWVEAAAL